MRLARWHPGIGDPTVFGWITVVGYALAALVAGLAARRAWVIEQVLDRSAGDVSRDRRAIRHFWVLVLATMVLLGVNKQLDLQSLLIEKIRNRAYVEGWYSDRRRYQMDFIAVMVMASTVAGLALAFWLRRVLRQIAWAILGLAMLVVFVLIRAASFHYVDKVLALGDAINVNQVLELGGIAVLLGAMLQWISTERRHTTTDTASGPVPPIDPAEVGARRL